MKKKRKISKKKIIRDVLFIAAFIIEAIFAIHSYSKLSHLNKYGITQQAVVDSFSLKKRHGGRGSTFYTATITYHIKNKTEQETCSFSHYPTVDYSKGSEFALITDTENNFKLPSIEKKAYKRNKVISPIIVIAVLFVCIYISEIIEHFSKNKKTKKQKTKINI